MWKVYERVLKKSVWKKVREEKCVQERWEEKVREEKVWKE